jgi:co-chaperonin GroES (HSP10)
MTDIKPISDRVLIKQVKQTMIGKIHVPDIMHPFYKEQGKIAKGIVLAVGPKVKSIKVDDVVYFSLFCGIEVDNDLMMREQDLVAVLEEPVIAS